MIKLVQGKDNEIHVKITSLISISGFSATLYLNGDTLTIPDAAKRNVFFTISKDAVARFDGKGREGLLVVVDSKGTEHAKQRIWFKPVATAAEAIDFKTIYVVITGDYKGGGGGGGGGGTVVSVNDVLPDASGNVTLTPSDIGVGYSVDESNENITLFLGDEMEELEEGEEEEL